MITNCDKNNIFFTRLRMSFWKHEPPKPTEAWRNFGPILESRPMALATSEMSAPVDSQISDIALMLEIRWARNALAANFDSSEDQVFIVMIRSNNKQTSVYIWYFLQADGFRSIHF